MAGMLRAARARERPVTAFVLSGGGNQGVGQVGMLRALLERGHRPDVIIGTSVGALNGAVDRHRRPPSRASTASSRSGSGLRGEEVFPGQHAAPGLEPAAPRRPPHPQRRAARRHHRGRPGRDVRGAPGPAPGRRRRPRSPATSTSSCAARSTRRCSASAALPGIFPPVEYNGHTLVDGAVVNLVPISHALAGPIDRIFVLDVSDPIGDRPIRSPLDVAVRAFAISRDQRFEPRAPVGPEGDRGRRAPAAARRPRVPRLLGRAPDHRRGVRPGDACARRPRGAARSPAAPARRAGGAAAS